MDKVKKRVLIVDDHRIREKIARAFTDCNDSPDSPYSFEADIAATPDDAIKFLRNTLYDVAVLDIRLKQVAEGLEIAHALTRQYGENLPVKIMFSGEYEDIATCVKAMRGGAWDYILKDAVAAGEMEPVDQVVKSAMDRLRMLDLQEELKRAVAQEWLPRQGYTLERDHPGKLVALWHKPEVHIVAIGEDAFSLQANLVSWQAQHETWEQPYLLEVPAAADASCEKG